MRQPLIAGNWKLHKTVSESLALVDELKRALVDGSEAEVVVAPVFTALVPVAQSLQGSGIQLAAQNCYPAVTGAFTGEVSPSLLADVGCRYIIVGHSERRQLCGESDAFINAKVKAVLAAGLRPILCIGETLQEREAGATFDVLRRQIEGALANLDASALATVVVAYEPVWAIGTGKTASNEQAQEAHRYIRGLIAERFGIAVANLTRILYGGSVKPDNVDGLMAQVDVDGALVGGASLKAEDFARIVRFQPV
jgi:triosephosphate isomerase